MVFVTIWILSAFISEFSIADFYKILLSKTVMASAIISFVFFLYFSFYFPLKKHFNYFFSLLIIIFCILLVIAIIFSKFLIQGLIYRPWGFDLVYNSFGMNLFLFYFLLLLIISIINIISSYIKVGKLQKLQLQYLFLGFILFIISIITFNVILPRIIESEAYYRLGSYSTIFFLGFTAYAIVKHRLMNIKVILTNVLVAIIGIILFAQIFLSHDLVSIITRVVIFALYTYFAYLLVKSVINEVKRREELAKLNTKLHRAYNELQKLDRAKDEFISVASHELKAPIAVIEGYLSMLLTGKLGKLEEKTAGYLERAYRSTYYLSKLAKDLLDASRITLGTLQIIKEPMHLDEFTKNQIEGLKQQAKDKNLYIKYQKEEKLPQVLVDSRRVGEIISNLLGNAIKFTESGGIMVSQKEEENFVLTEVTDTGPGIASEHLPHIFEKLYQVNPKERDKGGTGLGLYLTKSYIAMMGGKIWVKSKVGKGTTFSFTLPIVK